MKRIGQYLLCIILLLFSGKTEAQYYQYFSQYMLNGMAINPAYTGSQEVMSIAMDIRQQWIGFDGAPRTQTLGISSPLNNLNSAIGLSAFSDKLGVSRYSGAFFNYAYRLRFEKSTLSLGINGGLTFFKASFTDLDINEESDVAFESDARRIMPNFGMGAYYYKKSFFAGLSVPVILRYAPDLTENAPDSTWANTANWYLNMGWIIKLNKDLKLRPAFLLKTYPGYSAQLDLNLSLIVYDLLWMGFSIRTDDSFIWLIEYQLTDRLKIAYSHDFAASGLSRYTHGTNEFFIRYDLVNKKNVKSTKLF